MSRVKVSLISTTTGDSRIAYLEHVPAIGESISLIEYQGNKVMSGKVAGVETMVSLNTSDTVIAIYVSFQENFAELDVDFEKQFPYFR